LTGTAGGLAGGVLTGMAAEVGAASATARMTAGECRPLPDNSLLNGLRAALPP